jgi:hypothetical protein
VNRHFGLTNKPIGLTNTPETFSRCLRRMPGFEGFWFSYRTSSAETSPTQGNVLSVHLSGDLSAAITARTFSPRLVESTTALLRLDAGRADHLGPFLGFLRDELAEPGGRARERLAADGGKPCLHPGVAEGRIDFLAELVDDLS